MVEVRAGEIDHIIYINLELLGNYLASDNHCQSVDCPPAVTFWRFRISSCATALSVFNHVRTKRGNAVFHLSVFTDAHTISPFNCPNVSSSQTYAILAVNLHLSSGHYLSKWPAWRSRPLCHDPMFLSFHCVYPVPRLLTFFFEQYRGPDSLGEDCKIIR